MIERYQISLKVILLKGSLFLALRENKPGGVFDLPGGRIDDSEFSTPLGDIISREINEELGALEYELDEKPDSYGRKRIQRGSDKGTPILQLFFAARYIGGAITLSAEHTEFKWLERSAVDAGEMFADGIRDGLALYFK
jgi:8-oxo-dGTP pyrophosphatase MutT (NUDIX family)